jgi:hypothetical protein
VNKPLPAFDSDFATPAQWAEMYRACALQVVPGYMPGEGNGSWKRPLLSSWVALQDELMSDTAFAGMYGPEGKHVARPNMGMIAGRCSSQILVLDLDTHKNPAALAWWVSVLEVENNGIEPFTVEQRTGGGGRQLLFIAPADYVIPTIKTSQGVDIRGQGGFAVLPPSRHESGATYAWLPGRGPWETEIAIAEPWLLEAISDLAEAHGAVASHSATHATTSKSGISTPKSTISEGIYGGNGEQAVNEFGRVVDGRESLMRDVVWHAVLELYRYSAIKPGEPEWRKACAHAYIRYEQLAETRMSGAARTEGLEREGRGTTLFFQKFRRLMRLWGSPKMVEEAARPAPVIEPAGPRASEPPPEAEGVGDSDPAKEFQTQPQPRRVPLLSAFPIIEANIPTRNWVIPGLLLLRNLSVLVAPPGSGKSLLTLQLAIAVAIGMAWGGWTPRRAVKVLVINAEDDLDEMRRRLFAAAREMGVDHAALTGRLFLANAPETIVIARMDARLKTVIRTPLGDDLVATVLAEGIELVIADPFAETFEGDENSNSEVKWAGILWREVARRAACALLLVHHTKKYAGEMAGNADASRGGGALIGTARILSTLFAMTEDEAAAMNITPEDRLSYVRFDDAKSNHSRMELVRWFSKKTITLNNGDGLTPGDDVGVLVPWSPPGALDGVSIHALNLALDEIDRGLMGENGPTGKRYTASAAGARNDRWAGHVLVGNLGLSEDNAKRLIKEWLKSGTLEIIEYEDTATRKTMKGLIAPQQKRPGKAETFG